jgi:hypothetical protein
MGLASSGVALSTVTGMLALLAISGAAPRADVAQTESPRQLVQAMLEREEVPHADHYEYISQERSERTGGHLWTERVLETGQGKLRLLVAEDGKPLPPGRAAAERLRLDAIAADPASFARNEAAQKSDELHARQMLDSLPRGFILDNVRLENGVWHVDFHPDPSYSPSGIEEHVLHGMSGWFTIDAHDMRLRHIEGKLAQDVTMGMGLISIHAGSNFSSDRADEDGRWRTTRVHTDIRGRALLFKTISRNEDVSRSDFHYLEGDLTIPEAVALLEK